MRHLMLFLLLLGSTTAYAIPVTWTLDSVTFDDGGVAFGSYTYDAVSNTYTNVAITTSSGVGGFPGSFYEDACNVSTCHPDYEDSRPVFGLLDGTNLERIVVLTLEGPMTNSGGILEILVGGPACTTSCEVDDILNSRTIVAGSVSAVPIPAAVWLFGSALAGLGWLRRKQTV
jgi:hypothetical protein